nr:cell division control protein 6 homolog B isoform X2 [Aegilops tauschii subsp. strangulata]
MLLGVAILFRVRACNKFSKIDLCVHRFCYSSVRSIYFLTKKIPGLKKGKWKIVTTSATAVLIIADEMDYFITRDRAVLHDVFMLTNHQFSRCILIGIVNAIDPTDRFLPKLQSLNCFLSSQLV